MPTCADVCRHVPTSLIPTIWTLPPYWYVSAHVDMPTCADMCRHVLICADMCQHVPSLSASLIRTFGAYLRTGMCQHIWTCRHVLISCDMCRHAPTCSIISASLIPTIWTLPPSWHVSAHVDMPICADMCRHVPTSDITLDSYDANHLDMICIPVCVSTCGHADMC